MKRDEIILKFKDKVAKKNRERKLKMMRIYANAMIQQSRVPVPVPSSSNYRGPLQPQLLEAIIMYRIPPQRTISMMRKYALILLLIFRVKYTQVHSK